VVHPIGAEHHRSHRSPWLRAAILGANDGIVSTASLVVGVAAADSSRTAVVTAGIAGLVAGAMSMAAGEYVSVSSQRDAERADVSIETAAIEANRTAELRELGKIYEQRGVEPGLARLVAEQLMAHDAVGAHVRDELGITELAAARPLQAAWTSAVAFVTGALVPLLAVSTTPTGARIPVTAAVALVALTGLGALGASLGGAGRRRGALRIVTWSSLAMLATYAIGNLVGATI
jgi:VIT1/CCC1 family predicted Fe2+/Mn2+ transporter